MTAVAFSPVVQAGSTDVTLSAAAIALMASMLGVICAALGVMFRAYQGAMVERIADLQGTIVGLRRDLDYERNIGDQALRTAETATAAYRGREYETHPPERGSPRA